MEPFIILQTLEQWETLTQAPYVKYPVQLDPLKKNYVLSIHKYMWVKSYSYFVFFPFLWEEKSWVHGLGSIKWWTNELYRPVGMPLKHQTVTACSLLNMLWLLSANSSDKRLSEMLHSFEDCKRNYVYGTVTNI